MNEHVVANGEPAVRIPQTLQLSYFCAHPFVGRQATVAEVPSDGYVEEAAGLTNALPHSGLLRRTSQETTVGKGRE